MTNQVAQGKAQPTLEDMDAVVAAIWQEYASSLHAGSIDRWIAQWADDGVQMPPGGPYREGKEVIKAGVGRDLKMMDFTAFEITNLEVQAVNGWAFARGVYTGTMSPKAGGDDILIDGKYMTILQQQDDGSWKIYRDIFNSNVP